MTIPKPRSINQKIKLNEEDKIKKIFKSPNRNKKIQSNEKVHLLQKNQY